MSTKDRLQIILITFNRAEFVKEALQQFFFEGSPVIDYDFLVLDNNSTDNTHEVVKEFQEKHSNISYQKNRYNLGISGNIAKAMEIAEKDYVWIIGDDDKFDFSNWGEVENAIENNEEIICVARHARPNDIYTTPRILTELTFITGGVYKTSLFTDTTIKNAFDNIYTLFPHIAPVVDFINQNKKIYVVKKGIAYNGKAIAPDGSKHKTIDNSYIRGYKNPNSIYRRTRTMSWATGYSNICSLIQDKKLREEVLMFGFKAVLRRSETNILNHIFKFIYPNKEDMMQYIDIYQQAPKKLKKLMKRFILQHYFDRGIVSIYKISNIIYFKFLNSFLSFQFDTSNNPLSNIFTLKDFISKKIDKLKKLKTIFELIK